MRVLFFAHLRDVTGCEAGDVALAGQVDGEELWARLLTQYPGLAKHRPNVRLARDWEYADATTRFGEGDEVALIPPVSGG